MLRYLTAGESHGQALVGIIEGVPSGLRLTAEEFKTEMARRKLGYGRGFRQKIEDDQVRILSGVRHGSTLGSPIALMVENRDWAAWKEAMGVEPRAGENATESPSGAPRESGSESGGAAAFRQRPVTVPRPGHADWIGGVKYDHRDLRNVLERASARETAMRVAIATIARVFLSQIGVKIESRVVSIGSVTDVAPSGDWIGLREKIDASQVRCLDATAEKAMIAEIEAAKQRGDTLGGVIEVIAQGAPVGLGSYSQWDRRLEAEIGRQFLSLNAIKGVEIGLGFELARTPGFAAHDALELIEGRVASATSRSGGIDGGMSNGSRITVRAAMKPLATLLKPIGSVDLSTRAPTLAHVERSDVCAVPSAAVIGESLLALTLAQAVLEKFGGDSMAEVIGRVRDWAAHVAR